MCGVVLIHPLAWQLSILNFSKQMDPSLTDQSPNLLELRQVAVHTADDIAPIDTCLFQFSREFPNHILDDPLGHLNMA